VLRRIDNYGAIVETDYSSYFLGFAETMGGRRTIGGVKGQAKSRKR